MTYKYHINHHIYFVKSKHKTIAIYIYDILGLLVSVNVIFSQQNPRRNIFPTFPYNKLHHCKTIAISKSNGACDNKSLKRLIGVKEDIDRCMFLALQNAAARNTIASDIVCTNCFYVIYV